MRTSGIYGIRNAINGKWYIGSSIYCERRWTQHRRDLKAQRHMNPHLQYAWNEYGSNAFEFSILETCATDMLLMREDAWMIYYRSTNSEFGYNTKAAVRPVLSEETRKKLIGRKLTVEHRRKIGMGVLGSVKSKEARKKIGDAQRGPLNHRWGKSNSEELKKAHSAFVRQWYKDHPVTDEQKAEIAERVRKQWQKQKARGWKPRLFTDEQKQAASIRTKAWWDARRKQQEVERSAS